MDEYTDRGFNIGDVVVHRGEPVRSNPYAQHSLMGNERVQALINFKNGKPTPEYTFWYAPWGGGAKRLSSPADVDWETSGIDKVE
jgi:hypothetical protein